jgi:hypothetical protein
MNDSGKILLATFSILFLTVSNQVESFLLVIVAVIVFVVVVVVIALSSVSEAAMTVFAVAID